MNGDFINSQYFINLIDFYFCAVSLYDGRSGNNLHFNSYMLSFTFNCIIDLHSMRNISLKIFSSNDLNIRNYLQFFFTEELFAHTLIFNEVTPAEHLKRIALVTFEESARLN